MKIMVILIMIILILLSVSIAGCDSTENQQANNPQSSISQNNQSWDQNVHNEVGNILKFIGH